MPAMLKVVDQHFGSKAPANQTGVVLRLASERTSAREIIRSRVAAEIDKLNLAKQRNAKELHIARSHIITASETEPASGSASAWVWLEAWDLEKQVDRAVTAFGRRQFIMLLDDRQIDDLDEALGLRPQSEVVFLYLKPLKGG